MRICISWGNTREHPLCKGFHMPHFSLASQSTEEFNIIITITYLRKMRHRNMPTASQVWGVGARNWAQVCWPPKAILARVMDHLLFCKPHTSLFSDFPALSPLPHVKFLSIISRRSESSLFYEISHNSLPRLSPWSLYVRTPSRCYFFLHMSAIYVPLFLLIKLKVPSQDGLCSICSVAFQVGQEWKEHQTNSPEGRRKGNKSKKTLET